MDLNDATIKRIHDLCNQRKMSPHKLAITSGLPPSTLNSYLNGSTQTITQKTIQILCDGLGITIKEFYNCDIFEHIDQVIQ